MPWAVAGAVIGAVGTYESTQSAKKGAQNAANAQMNAATQANALQKQIYDQNTTNVQPWMTAGSGALSAQQSLLGLNGQAPDYSGFMNSPGRQFAMTQGMNALDASAASRGNLFSGGYGKQLTEFGQGLANQQFNNYYNQLGSMAGQGLTAGDALAGVGTNYANAAGNNLNNAGTAQASGYINSANATSNMYNQLGALGGNLAQQFTQSSYGNDSPTPQMQINPGQPQAQYNYGSVPNVTPTYQPIQASW